MLQRIIDLEKLCENGLGYFHGAFILVVFVF